MIDAFVNSYRTVFYAGRPIRPRLPHLQAAWRPDGGRGGDHLAEAGGELADLPWSIDIGIARIEDLDLA